MWRRWQRLLGLAERSGELSPVWRGGERRAIALANPGLGGAPFATPTLWAAIQYINPGEDPPVHRHSQHAFRFVVEGEGVRAVVDGDPVAMRRGDFHRIFFRLSASGTSARGPVVAVLVATTSGTS